MKETPIFMPFMMWHQQKELVEWVIERIKSEKDNDKNGAVAKSRGIGATWICCSISEWLWSFYSDVAIGWGSNKAESVDNKNDPNCIFEKIRTLIQYKPQIFMPKGYNSRIHDKIMNIVNPENGSSIVGKAGDQIGRGGRSTVFFNDEKAFYEHAESREAALSGNTDHIIDISTPNGVGNVFYNTVHGGVTPTFFCHWEGDPRKDRQWYESTKREYEAKGLIHLFYQEVDISFSASVDMVVIKSEWVEAAIDAHKKLNIVIGDEEKIESALDVADEGGDLNCQATRKSIFLFFMEAWAEGDTGITANRAWNNCLNHNVSSFKYDSIGVGAGVKAETNKLKAETTANIKVEGWNAAGAVIDPWSEFLPGKKNRDMFANAKCQAAWDLRMRFEKTYKAVQGIEKPPADELISISSDIPDLNKFKAELCQPQYSFNSKGQIVIKKKPDGAKSPNRFDAVVIVFARDKAKTVIGY